MLDQCIKWDSKNYTLLIWTIKLQIIDIVVTVDSSFCLYRGPFCVMQFKILCILTSIRYLDKFIISQTPTCNDYEFLNITVFCIINTPVRSQQYTCVTSWLNSWDSQFSNSGFGLKIGQLFKKLWSISWIKFIPRTRKLWGCDYCTEYSIMIFF